MTRCDDLLAELQDETVFETAFNEMTSAVARVVTAFTKTTGQMITVLKPVINTVTPLEVDIDVYYQPNPLLDQLSADEEMFEAIFDEMIEAVTAITTAFIEATGETVPAFEPQLVRRSPLEFDVDVKLATLPVKTTLGSA
jgi:hypothetical protein